MISPGGPKGWSVERRAGAASELLGPWPAATLEPVALPGPPPASSGRRIALCSVTGRALVLGSTQPEGAVDLERAVAGGVAVVRRPSGGGAVLIVPGEVVWIEVWIPAADPLWEPDIARSALWLGETWRRALLACGVAQPGVHRGPADQPELARRVCMAGIVPGEVSAGGRKIVGISQRRGRRGVRYQAAALLRWCPERLACLLAGGAQVLPAIAEVAAGIEDLVPGTPPTEERLRVAFLDALP